MAILPLQLARVSNAMRMNVATSTLARTQQNLLQVQNELASGKRLNSASDDPGDAAIAQQLRKTLEQRSAYLTNIQQASSNLSAVDTTLGDVSSLITRAQEIASANVGSGVTADQRASAAEVVKSIMNQMLSLGNKQFEGAYLFGGDKTETTPFVEQAGGIEFVGTTGALVNSYDESTVLPFTVSGNDVFGALSTRVQGTADLTPAVTTSTLLSDLRGATFKGVRAGSIQISNGTTSAAVDLSKCSDLQDVIRQINATGLATASISSDDVSILLSPVAGTDTLSVTEVGGGTTASDLGILQTTPLAAGAPLDGAALNARITAFTKIADLRGGAGIGTAGGLKITNGQTTVNVAVPSAAGATVQDLLNAINNSGTFVRAEINSAATGFNIFNPTSGARMTIAENGGTTAADLGVRSYSPATQLSELNSGKGVRTVSGADFTVSLRDGTSFSVDLSSAQLTVQDVINQINTAAGTTVASFATTGNGIVLTDPTAGAGTFAVTAQNFSTAAADLGLDVAASGGVIAGRDVNPIDSSGIFTNLAKLRDALLGNDQSGITAASEGLDADAKRVTRIRGLTGARVQEMENRQERLEDENTATKALLSGLEDTDYTDAIARFQLLQSSLDAALATSGRILTQSLMDFLS